MILVEFWDVDIATAMARNLVVDASFYSLEFDAFPCSNLSKKGDGPSDQQVRFKGA